MRMMLAPPVLPLFLASTYDLKPVEGVPSDEEVKMVHAVIRALNDVMNDFGNGRLMRDEVSVPALYNADLAMRLSMHLFSLQMGRSGSYSCWRFVSDTIWLHNNNNPRLPSLASIQLVLNAPAQGQNITHTPPQLPAHVPVRLEPVTGPPSDEQTKSVQTALRLYESMVNIPSMFDADLSMKLSQHLFDIQFERYIRRIMSEDSPAPATDPQTELPYISGSDGLDPHDIQGDAGEAEGNGELDTRDLPMAGATPANTTHESTQLPPRLAIPTSRTTTQNAARQVQHIQPIPDQDCAGRVETRLEDTNKLLAEIGDGLKTVKQILVGSQHAMARGINSAYFGQSYANHTCSFINTEGEDPMHLGLPSPSSMRNMQTWNSSYDTTLARYLQFYGIGDEFIQEGDEPTIVEGKRDEVKARLLAYLNLG
ncbi:hypothetical protein FRC10_011423 [Ceratobasidium sp. 414]|nr:hypothetical protein FRC10_011423 [Ceratobasidium sp. 414]